MVKMCVRPGWSALPIRRLAKVAPVFLAGFLASCANLPDLSGYSAATLQVKQSVAAAGDAVESEIAGAVDGFDDADQKRLGRQVVTNFQTSWTDTVKSLDAMVKYANSLEAIAAAGNKGAESANRVADSIQGLASAVGLVPAGPAIGAVADTAAFVYGEIAKVRAAKSLAESVEASGPVVRRIGEVVSKQVNGARGALDISIAAQKADLKTSPAGLVFDQDKTVAAAEARLQSALARTLTDNPNDNETIKKLQGQLAVFASARAGFKPSVDAFQSKLAALVKRETTARQLVRSARSTLDAWSVAHDELVTAIRTSRSITLTSLLAAVTEARAIIKKWEEL